MKRPTSFRPIVDRLEVRSLLSSSPPGLHPATDVHDLQLRVRNRLMATLTTLTSSAPQSSYGAEVTFTATVLASKRKAGNPTGTVTFKDGNAVLASIPVAIKKHVGTASFGTPVLGPGNHAIIATYSGNKRLAASSNATSVALQVPRLSTMLTLTSPDSSPFGNPVTFTATVTTSGPTPGQPTGGVTFTDGGTVLGQAPLQVVNGAEQAVLVTSSLSTGSHSIVATYAGDGNFNPSSNDSSPRALQVVPAATTLKLSASSTGANVGDQISFTAMVLPSGSPPVLPTGPVLFFEADAPTQLHPVELEVVNGVAQASFTITLTAADVGNHLMSAIYAGDGNFLSSHS